MTGTLAANEAHVIRDVLLGGFFLVWAVVVTLTAIRTGTVPAELWAVLGVGIGGILGVFQADERARRGGNHRDGQDRTEGPS